ncbi:hypothetical protein [Pseudodesulfovibrio nedwellii]|uniref:hypothetical protein n=1 Tax=Pseudodesulfovibrio nedwellii TaxID=2973072 RepID=UPI002490EC12|nr:hypothetical protein [Pseudodesulfovibrio nedwellii]
MRTSRKNEGEPVCTDSPEVPQCGRKLVFVRGTDLDHHQSADRQGQTQEKPKITHHNRILRKISISQ